MIFTSFEFVIFFAAVLLIQSCINNFTVEKWFLLFASYVFYMSWSIPCALLLLGTTLVDYFVGLSLSRIANQYKRTIVLGVSIAINLGVLGYFKYTNFMVDQVWWVLNVLNDNVTSRHYEIVLPIGISFFTFQRMTYTIETYRRNIQPCQRPQDFLLFGVLFPQLLAGPINRASDLLPQIIQRIRATALDFEAGLAQFSLGAVKKLVISDRIGPHIDLIFGAPGNYDGFTLLQGLLGYAIQIYCDFSGYSDMAIGCARMMGFRFTENFQMPYSAVSIAEFWKRWHISLSTWFRDYLYIPLGGNRSGQARTYINLMLTMLLCGLWHGASWNFVFWGGLHGFSLAIHKGWNAWNPLHSYESRQTFQILWTLFSRILTLGVVLVGWLFFRAQSWEDAILFIHQILTWDLEGTRMVSPYILSALGAVLLVHVVVKKDVNWTQGILQKSFTLRTLYYTALVLLIIGLGATDSSPFIYFQF